MTVPGCGPLLALRTPLQCIGLLPSHLYPAASGKYAMWRILGMTVADEGCFPHGTPGLTPLGASCVDLLQEPQDGSRVSWSAHFVATLPRR